MSVEYITFQFLLDCKNKLPSHLDGLFEKVPWIRVVDYRRR